MDTPALSVLIYEYPTLGGPPFGTVELDAAFLEHPETARLWAECLGGLASVQDDGTLVYVGNVFRYPTGARPATIDILLRVFTSDGETLCLNRNEVATTLLPVSGQHFLEIHAEAPWVPLLDVVLWAQYESSFAILFLADHLARIFLPVEQQARIFRLGQGFFPTIERNRRRERQALRRAFTHALPHLLPGMRIAQKKPGYGWKKGRADFFLSQQAEICPTQLLREPVSQTCVETLREAMQAYHSPRGYVVAPALDADVVLDDNMVFVPFGGEDTRQGSRLSPCQ